MDIGVHSQKLSTRSHSRGKSLKAEVILAYHRWNTLLQPRWEFKVHGPKLFLCNMKNRPEEIFLLNDIFNNRNDWNNASRIDVDCSKGKIRSDKKGDFYNI